MSKSFKKIIKNCSEMDGTKRKLDSISENLYEAATTSSQAGKMQKITSTRRDAIDEFNKENISGAHIKDLNNDSFLILKEEVRGELRELKLEMQNMKVEIEDFKKEVKNDLTGLRRSVLYNLNKIDEKLSSVLSAQNKSNSLADLKKKLGIECPINDINTFYEFDRKIKEEDDCVCLREIFGFKMRTKNLYDAIGGTLSLIMSIQLQLQFSACGKPNKGISKENFSRTRLYCELKDYLLNHFETESESSILTKTSRWFASARDRCGGRSQN